MAKACPPGVFCIENISIMYFIFVFVLVAIYIYYTKVHIKPLTMDFFQNLIIVILIIQEMFY